MNLGISIDGVTARGVLVAPDGQIVARASCLGGIGSVLEEILKSTNGAVPESIGIALADPDPGTWDVPTVEGSNGEKIPLRTLSSGNAAALAEMWYGQGRGVRHMIAVLLGRSVSAGAISNGALLVGAHGLASSVSWLSLNPVEREDYRKMGCLEAEAAVPGIVKRLVWRIKSGDRSRVLDRAGGSLADISLEHVLAGARDGDGVAVSVIRDTVRYLAMAVSNMAVILDPEVIVLGGILASARDLLLDPIRHEYARRMPSTMQERVKIVPSQLGEDAAPLGAARFAATGSALP